MLRLEPGHEMRIRLAADFAEADEGVHLVDVAAHRLGIAREGGDGRIAGTIEQLALAAGIAAAGSLSHCGR